MEELLQRNLRKTRKRGSMQAGTNESLRIRVGFVRLMGANRFEPKGSREVI